MAVSKGGWRAIHPKAFGYIEGPQIGNTSLGAEQEPYTHLL